MSYNTNNNPAPETENRNELWQRQKAVLEALTEAEKLVYKGMELQSPLYDMEFGKKRNLISVTTMLRGAERMLFILAPQLKDDEGNGVDSATYKLFITGLNKTQTLINQGLQEGIDTPLGQKKLGEAYILISGVLAFLRQETADLGFDFRKKPALEDEWAE